MKIQELYKRSSPRHFREIKYFSKDGKNIPNGVYLQKGEFIQECIVNKDSFILDEGIRPIEKQGGLAFYRGGIIVFSADVNAKELSKNKILNWLEQHWQTIYQRLNRANLVHRTINSFNETYKKLSRELGMRTDMSDEEKKKRLAEEDYIGGYSVGNAFRGSYVGDKGERYNEKSFTIEIDGLSTKGILRLAEMIAKEFQQESVLVKDLNENKIYYADTSERDPNAPIDLSQINTKCKN